MKLKIHISVRDFMGKDGHVALLQELIQRRGYVVIAVNPGFAPYRIGEVLTEIAGFEVEQPFRIMADTNVEDWLEQSDILCELRPDVTEVLGSWRNNPEALKKITQDKFQRAVTD